MIFEINVHELVISVSVSRIVVSDSVNFWQAKVNLDSDFEGLNKKIVFYTDTVSKDILLPENGIVTVPYEVLTPGSELRFTISGYDDNRTIHTMEMFSSVKIFSAGKFIGDNPDTYSPELWEQVMAKLNTQISADIIYNPESENAQSGKALSPIFQKKFEVWIPNTEYKAGDFVLSYLVEEICVGNECFYALTTGAMMCLKDHISPNIDYPNLANDFDEYWAFYDFRASEALSALKDLQGRPIHLTYATKEEMNNLISGGLKREVVETLPTATSENTNVIYMVKNTSADDKNVYDEYISTTNEKGNYYFELIGSTAVDLSNKMDKFAEVTTEIYSEEECTDLHSVNHLTIKSDGILSLKGDAVFLSSGADMCGAVLKNVGYPELSDEAANKAYVDNAIGDIDTALDAIIELQNSIIGGE